MKVNVEAWKCEIKNCGHVWIATTDVPPERCSKCKSRQWHKVAPMAPLTINELDTLAPAVAPMAPLTINELDTLAPMQSQVAPTYPWQHSQHVKAMETMNEIFGPNYVTAPLEQSLNPNSHTGYRERYKGQQSKETEDQMKTVYL